MAKIIAKTKIQRTLRKIKDKLPNHVYRKIYPTGSIPGKFYGTAKRHKLPANGTVHDLPVRQIVSNIGTASYYLAKHLAKLLSPLNKSEYTVTNTVEFIRSVKNLKVPVGYHFVSFDVKSLFTNVLLNYTIDLILKRIYEKIKLPIH